MFPKKKTVETGDVQKRRLPELPNTFKIGFLRFNANGLDLLFAGIVLALLTVGLVMMFSASYAYAYHYNDGNSFYYITRQLIFAVIGVTIMFFASFVDYHFWYKMAIPVYAVSLILLVLALLSAEQSHVHRWISVAGISVQPSEIAKFAIILIFSDYAVRFRKEIRIHTFRYGVLPYIGLLLPIVVLLVLEPHLSGTIICCAIALIMMFISGVAMKWFVAGGVVLGVGVAGVIFSGLISYAQARLNVWKNPWDYLLDEGWQTVQSLYAIGSGGFLGVGLGNSRQKQLYISEPQNDFIFAVVCEELGLIGAIVIILMFAFLVWRGFVIGLRAPDTFGMLLATGVSAQIGVQTALNIAVVTNTIPNTGISLPFFSYGGSSLVMLLFEMSIVLSVSRQSKVRKT